jgi:2-polyprenyl-6-hydroxyphenyl methylase/3-demethylubiquinone-9 3-methyltransferase
MQDSHSSALEMVGSVALNEKYEDVYKNERRFSFGKNWSEFLKHLTPERIDEAKKSLNEFLGNISGKTFVDVGCGSGLFSLAAAQLGAKEVLSIDADEFSVGCANALKEKFKIPNWTAKQGSILDNKFIKSLGQFDIVYSWGVLHHTGDMYSAFNNVDLLVKPNGVLFIAIYNKNTKHILEGTSSMWLKIKKLYNKMPKAGKKLMEWSYASYLYAGITAKGKNPVKYVKNYKTVRGMNFMTDVRDWLGGLPYECATPDEVISYFSNKGYDLVKQKNVRSIGCNEFMFRKK